MEFSMANKNGGEAASVLKEMFPHTYINTVFDVVLRSSFSSVAGIGMAVSKSEGIYILWLIFPTF
jgi:hypothetical protein